VGGEDDITVPGLRFGFARAGVFSCLPILSPSCGLVLGFRQDLQ